MQLSQRATRLLEVLVETHIREATPVGSKVLAQCSGLNVSAATIRNVMAELEEAGASVELK